MVGSLTAESAHRQDRAGLTRYTQTVAQLQRLNADYRQVVSRFVWRCADAHRPEQATSCRPLRRLRNHPD
jgi:2-oxo-4-hydroxy-4-carboxy--5-ureidoimidazoline (OHCU) decarboxylase